MSDVQGLVMVLATSNKPWDLDEAVRRRLEKRICFLPLVNLILETSLSQIATPGCKCLN